MIIYMAVTFISKVYIYEVLWAGDLCSLWDSDSSSSNKLVTQSLMSVLQIHTKKTYLHCISTQHLS